jgi:hypothetical protein
MRQSNKRVPDSAEKTVRDIRRATNDKLVRLSLSEADIKTVKRNFGQLDKQFMVDLAHQMIGWHHLVHEAAAAPAEISHGVIDNRSENLQH